MYKCKHFRIYELVDPFTYKERGQKAWKLFDERILIASDLLRKVFGPCVVNDWKHGGQFKWSGFRTAACKVGAKYSDHRSGRALDLKFKNAKPEEVRQWIKDNEYVHIYEILGIKESVLSENMPLEFALSGKVGSIIRSVEKDTETWVHISCRNTNSIEWVSYV